MRKINLMLLMLLVCIGSARAVDVEIWVRTNTDKVFKIVSKDTGDTIEHGDPDNFGFTVSMTPGDYEFSMYTPDGATMLGALDVEIEDVEKHGTLMFYIGTFNVKNTKEDGSAWVEGEDYELALDLQTQHGDARSFRMGHDEQGRHTVLLLTGDHLVGTATPSQTHQEEGYLAYSARRASNGNATLDLTMPKGVLAHVTVPNEASLQIGTKTTHYVDFSLYDAIEEKENGDTKTYTYRVLPNTQINYRTWCEGGLTRAGYFRSGKDESSETGIEFTQEDYQAMDPKAINHSVTSNSGYETGDILVNGNERGHISLAVGDTFKAHAMRSWELTDNSTGNYFMEPDFHYTVVDLDGKPLDGVLEITSKPGSAWADIKAVSAGTAIVLVTYDAIGVDYYSDGERNPFMGGSLWGAIWPENTAAYVVSVGQQESAVKPNMFINEDYNTGALKVAGKNVDAEHDVFYYLDTEEGFTYTFSPENVAEISIAYPLIGEHIAEYTGFTTDGVKKNEDGSWSLTLKHGRQIVKMTDTNGNATFQVMRARECHREIVNVSRPGSKIYQPGDEVKIQYSGLFHPANKLAGIYNMSAYVTYNGVPNGSSLILSANQYTFAAAPAAQAVKIQLAEDYDVEANPQISLSKGVLQVNGYGDPIGNHRLVDPEKGRNANFAAIAHKTYFGSIPDASFTVTPFKAFNLKFVPNVDDAELSVVFKGKELSPNGEGLYEGTYGTYEVTAKKPGYICLHNSYTVDDDAEGLQTFAVELQVAPEGAWDGKTMTRPQTENGVFHITNGAELAWFANEVNTNDNTISAELGADIELASYEWTPIGTSQQKYTGTFNGNYHTVKGLYINRPTETYCGMFSYIAGSALITSLKLEGEVHGGDYSGGIVGQASEESLIDRCANYANVSSTQYNGGVVGYLFRGPKLTNSYNAGTVSSNLNAGGLVGMIFQTEVDNIYNIGEVICPTNGSALTGRLAGSTATNVYVNRDYELTFDYTVANDEQFASGEIAWRMGEAFGQTIGEEDHPVLNGAKVFKVIYSVLGSAVAEALEDAETALYTNGTLPEKLNGEEAHWYEDADMTMPVNEVGADASLFVKLGSTTGIDGINTTPDANARWYNVQGVEIAAPAEGERGIFIRVVNGKSEKVIL